MKWLDLLRMIRFEHSVFALPFAVATALYATDGTPHWGPYGWILLAMVAARTTAMAFNRIADRRIDALNPRTRERHLPSGSLKPGHAWLLLALSSALFVLSAGMLNTTCLILSPVLLLFLMLYSLTKRFTWLCHLYLGLSLGLAPVGVWIGLTEEIAPFPLILGGSILFWVAGFDIIYACLDAEFDRSQGLQSIPARFGIRNALIVSALFHLFTAAGLVLLGIFSELGWLYWALLAPVIVVLAVQHWLVRPDELKRVNVAFFNLNAVFSIALMAALVADSVVS